MKRIALLAFALVLLSAIVSVGVAGLQRLRIAYASHYVDISVDTAYNMITNGSYPDLVVLDVRTQNEYDSGHIHVAILIPHTELDKRIEELADHENLEIIVYCRTGVRSAIGSEILDSHNFTKVHNMLGGISSWQSAGYPFWTPEEDALFWRQWWFWAILTVGIVALSGTVLLMKKRKPPVTPPLPPEGTDTDGVADP